MREDWVEVEIGKFAKIKNGYAFKSKEYVDNGLRIIRIANVQTGEIIDRDPKFYPVARLSEFEDYIIEEDDFLISLTGNVGRVGRIDKSLLPALLNQRVGKLTLLTNLIEKNYLYYFLNSREFVHQVIKNSKGVAQLNTSSKKIEEIKLPICPLPEQRAIVAKIEELFSDLDKGIADLKKAQAQLKVYRQAVLKKAFEGELTKEWRDTNKITYDWTNVNLSDISDSCLGKMLDKVKNKGLLKPYLGNINVRWGKFNTDSLKTMRIEDSEHVRFQLIKGDLVICEGGEPGRCAVWQNDESIFIQKALHRVRFKTNCNPYYFYYYFFYQAKVGGLDAYFTGTTIKHLTGRKLKEFKVPFCSTKEQHQIVQEIESRLSVCDKVEQTITESLEKAKALRQSILKKAFAGSLLSAAEIEQCKQAPDYEPASVLLAKIKVETLRQAQGKKKK